MSFLFGELNLSFLSYSVAVLVLASAEYTASAFCNARPWSSNRATIQLSYSAIGIVTLSQ